MSTPVSGSGPVLQAVDVRSMDLETALMAVQSNRASLLESQLKGQIEDVQKKNDRIAGMNRLLGVMNGIAAQFDSGAKAGDTVTISKTDLAALQSAAREAGVTLPPELTPPQVTVSWTVTLRDGTTHTVDEAGRKDAEVFKSLNWAYGSTDYSGRKGIDTITEGAKGPAETMSVSKGNIDKQVQGLKSSIDALSNSQQMDMLRLQSLSNKRNEAFDIMTNSVKKFADARSSIVGNMR